MNTNAKITPSSSPWWVAAMLAATAALPGCAGSEDKGPSRPTAEATLTSARDASAQGDTQAALTRFEETIALDPKMVSAYIGAGDIYRTRGDYTSALARYTRATELDPSSFDAQYNLGLTSQLMGRYGNAVRAYLKAIPLKPEDFDASLNIATAYLQLGEASQAALYGQYAVKLDPMSAPARITLAEADRALGLHEKAVDEYQQAASLTNLPPEVMLNQARSLGEVGRYADMAEVANRVIQTLASPAAYETLGTALFKQAQYDPSLAAFQKALAIDPDYCPALNGAGVCLLNKFIAGGSTDRNTLDAAVAALRRSLQINRGQPRVAELLSRWG